VNVVFGNSGRLLLVCGPAYSPKFVSGRLLPRHPFFLATRIALSHFFRNISTHCQRIHSAFSKLNNSSQNSNVARKSATAVFQCRSLTRTCFNWFCRRIIDRCFFSRYLTTHTFFHLLNVLKLGCPILLANCFKENSICFRLIGGLPSALPKSDESSLSSAATYAW
jgi:hypothetical protein